MANRDQKVKKAGNILVFDMKDSLCVWSKAGVLKPLTCVNAFDCLDCPVDRKMKAEIKAGRLRHGRVLAGRDWCGEIKPRPIEEKKCRHMLSGRVSIKYCINDYDCARCEYHQWMMDENAAEPMDRPDQEIVGGFILAKNYYYHFGHVWARVEYGGRVRVGLDDFAGRLFGPFNRFNLPRIGQVVRQGEPGFGFIRGRFDARCLSPLEGMVVAVNPAARENGEIADDPYGRGWLLVLEPQKLRLGLRNLLFMAESRAWMEEEASRLMNMLPDESEYQLAATGGLAIPDIFGQYSDLGWERLRREFLGT